MPIAEYPFAPGWSGAKSYEGSAQFPHAMTGTRTHNVSASRRAPYPLAFNIHCFRCKKFQDQGSTPVLRNHVGWTQFTQWPTLYTSDYETLFHYLQCNTLKEFSKANVTDFTTIVSEMEVA